MIDNPYTEKIEQLRQGTLAEIVVEREELLIFREAWRVQEDKRQIVGEAGLNGRIIYRYVQN